MKANFIYQRMVSSVKMMIYGCVPPLSSRFFAIYIACHRFAMLTFLGDLLYLTPVEPNKPNHTEISNDESLSTAIHVSCEIC